MISQNILSDKYNGDSSDAELVAEAVRGNKDSLEKLVKKHQDYIYNIALRMVFYPDEAKDVTQEVLIKIITKLSSFEGRSSFRTWAYRIVVNHVLNIRKSLGEVNHADNFVKYAQSIDNCPDGDFPDNSNYSVDSKILVEEVKISCMFGMLLCLDREQRLVYTLGSLLGVSDTIGSEIMEISKDNFRQKLSRARKDLHSFMFNKCGLVNKENPCRCSKKTKFLINVGYVNPDNLRFTRGAYFKMDKIAGERTEALSDILDNECSQVFRTHPYQQSPDFVESLREILKSDKFNNIFTVN
ncbi:MAG: RNA polymerase sigma factor [Ignavibacteria bacterium]|nr:RNA polymerase sigma factor [Ignavibacteria bacterium]